MGALDGPGQGGVALWRLCCVGLLLWGDVGFVQPLTGQRGLQQAVRGHWGNRGVQDLWGFRNHLLLADDAGDGLVVEVVVRLVVYVKRVRSASFELGCICCNLLLMALLG